MSVYEGNPKRRFEGLWKIITMKDQRHPRQTYRGGSSLRAALPLLQPSLWALLSLREPRPRTHGLKVEGPGKVPVRLSVNGVEHRISAEPRLTLADAIRDELGLTGTKIICDRGECGGCTVLMDGMPVYSCMMLAIESQDRQILTVEGLYKGDQLHPVQQAFIEKDALMCGFCTPGFIMSVKALLDQNPNPTLEEVKKIGIWQSVSLWNLSEGL